MKKSLVSMMAVAAVLAAADAAQAQLPTTPLSVVVRGGLVFPSGDLADEDELGGVESGVTLGADLEFAFTPMFSAYAGYSWNQFGIEDVDDADVTDQGFHAGVIANFAAGSISPFVKAGAVMHNLSISVDDESEDAEDESIGFQVGGGVNIPLGNRLTVVPGVTYTSYKITLDEIDDDPTISHIAAEVGLKIRI